MDARRTMRAVVRAVIALVSAAALVVTGFGWSLQQRADTGVVTSEGAILNPHPTSAGEAFTALLVGLDSRTDAHGDPLPAALFDALHVGPDEGQLNTDTMILLHVPADPHEPAVAISIPRDSYVPIAGGYGTHKINSAYERGMLDAEAALQAQGIQGAELDRRARDAGRRVLVQTVQDLTGVTIDHFAEIGMAGFVELTDALGGVPVCLKAPERDSYSGIDLPAGPSVVSGPEALAFVRQRHGLPEGDLDRIVRQQAFAAGLMQRVLTAGTLADPGQLQRLVDIATRYIVLDRGWDIDQALSGISLLSSDALTFHTIPTGRPDLQTPADGVAVEVDRDAVQTFVESILEPGAAPAPPGPGTLARPTAAPTSVQPADDAAPVTVRPAEAPQVTPTSSSAPVISANGVPCVN